MVGLPYYFTLKVRDSLLKFDGKIDFINLTYVDIIITINKRNLTRYNDLRLKIKLIKKGSYAKK